MSKVTTSERIAEAVAKRGLATTDELMEDLPGMTRNHMQRALSNAKSLGLIRHVRVGVAKRGQTIPALYGPPYSSDALPAIASVWDLALPVARSWSGGEGRTFNLLGSWTD